MEFEEGAREKPHLLLIPAVVYPGGPRDWQLMPTPRPISPLHLVPAGLTPAVPGIDG